MRPKNWVNTINVCLIVFLPVLTVFSFISDSALGAWTIVKVEPCSSSANLGETFNVNITIEDVANLYGFEIKLSWDPTTLSITGVDVRTGQPDGILNSPVFTVVNNITEGRFLYAAVSTTPALPFNGNGTIMRITFNVTSFADSTLHLETQLCDYPPPDRWPRVSLPIEHVTIDGAFLIIPEFGNIGVMLCICFLFLLTSLSFCFYRRIRPSQAETSLQTKFISAMQCQITVQVNKK
jgi:hypothetical protein